jgi:hypothetical protein
MPRTTTIVSPYELCKFAETFYGISNSKADTLVRWVRPECEVKTYDYELAACEDLEDEDACTDYAPARQLLIDFMKEHKLKKFTLTQ